MTDKDTKEIDDERQGDENAEEKVEKSPSNLAEVLHGGRPKDEEPHVKKSGKKKKEGEEDAVEYIVRVDLESLGINEDEFDDLQSLFQLFDRDKDGILTIKETQMLLRCLGLKPTLDQAKAMVSMVTPDITGFSISFNEYLRLISIQRRADPDEETLLEVFQTFDPANSGQIGENEFRKIMKSKEGIPDEDIEEMLDEYKRLEIVTGDADSTVSNGAVILYKEFIGMLQL